MRIIWVLPVTGAEPGLRVAIPGLLIVHQGEGEPLPSWGIHCSGRDMGSTRGLAMSPYLVDAELALEAAACPIVQRDLHGVVNVAHLVPAHLILDVEPDHCGRG